MSSRPAFDPDWPYGHVTRAGYDVLDFKPLPNNAGFQGRVIDGYSWKGQVRERVVYWDANGQTTLGLSGGHNDDLFNVPAPILRKVTLRDRFDSWWWPIYRRIRLTVLRWEERIERLRKE